MTYEKAYDAVVSTLADGLITAHIENRAFWKTVKEALGKQIKKKPKLSTAKSTVCPNLCPNCGRFIDMHEQKHGNIEIPCCKWCGQALDWSDEQ